MSDKKDCGLFRRQRIVTHTSDVLIHTRVSEGNPDFIYFGISRRNPKDPVNKKLGKEVAKVRSERAMRRVANIWTGGPLPFSGGVKKTDLKKLLNEFHRGNFRRS